MPQPDAGLVSSVASRYNIPPPILYALAMHQTSWSDAALHREVRDGRFGIFGQTAGSLRTSGFSGSDVAGDLPLQTELAARQLADDFRQYGSWERALSAYETNDPDAYQSPTSDAGGSVYSTLAIAAANPTWGMGDFHPADQRVFMLASHAYQRTMTDMASSGGAITTAHVQQWQDASNRVTSRAPAITGRSGDTNYPFRFAARPFDPSAAVTEPFGDTSGPGHYSEAGNDYGLRRGTPVAAPMSGTVHVTDYGHRNTGLTAFIRMDNGWTIGLGHMGNLHVQDGQRVNAGEVVGVSGGDPNLDTSPGNSSGAHIELQLIDPQGRYHDPHPLVTGAIVAQQPTAAAQPNAPVPQGPTPQQVSDFATRLQNAGIDPDHFAANYGHVSAMRRRLLENNTEPEDYAPMAGMDRSQMLQYVQSQPHPKYPDITAGHFNSMNQLASLLSVSLLGRTPFPSEVSRLASSNANWQQVQGFYGSLAGQDTAAAAPQAPPPAQQTATPDPYSQRGRRMNVS